MIVIEGLYLIVLICNHIIGLSNSWLLSVCSIEHDSHPAIDIADISAMRANSKRRDRIFIGKPIKGSLATNITADNHIIGAQSPTAAGSLCAMLTLLSLARVVP
jgi:hypothetical protein